MGSTASISLAEGERPDPQPCPPEQCAVELRGALLRHLLLDGGPHALHSGRKGGARGAAEALSWLYGGEWAMGLGGISRQLRMRRRAALRHEARRE